MSGFHFYDLETSGRDPRWHRVLQYAGLRTDDAFAPLAEPVVLEVALPPDVLPEPEAMLVTSITPEAATRGMHEAAFAERLAAELETPGLCLTGFNNLRFDDEFVRYTLYRNLRDPYAHEWRSGRSRFDLMDLVRAAWALRPDGVEWPCDAAGVVSLRLEALARANGLEHARAHDAASDVLATVALARLLRAAQPRLFAHYFALRERGAAERLLWPRRPEPVVHVSGRLPRARRHLGLVTPLGRHLRNPRAFLVFDLAQDPEPLASLDDAAIVARTYAAGGGDVGPATGMEAEPDRAAGALSAADTRLAIKEVKVNRGPFLAPLTVVRAADADRLGIDVALQRRRHAWLCARPELCARITAALSAHDRFADAPEPDVDGRLYEGFASDRDRDRCRELVSLDAAGLAARVEASRPAFDDARLDELLFRFRARNHPQALGAAERARWRAHCRDRLHGRVDGPLSLAAFDARIDALRTAAADTAGGQALLDAWRAYARHLAAAIEFDVGWPQRTPAT